VLLQQKAEFATRPRETGGPLLLLLLARDNSAPRLFFNLVQLVPLPRWAVDWLRSGRETELSVFGSQEHNMTEMDSVPEAIMTGDGSPSVALSPAPMETKIERTDE